MSDRIDVSEWINYAKGDLHLVEIGLKDENPPYHTICFLCQSSAEKLLKALLLKQGWPLKKSHDLLYLGNELKEFKFDLSGIWLHLVELNNYISETRYPGDISIDSYTGEMAKKAFESAKQVREFIITNLH